MDNTRSPASPDARPDPTGTADAAPARISEILTVVRTLTAYGRHVSSLVARPRTWFGFVIFARFFGTVTVPDIAAHIQRGIMRALALEAMLLRRTRRGADLVVPAPPRTTPRKAPARTQPAEQKAPRPQAPPLTLANLPTQQEIEAEVRRRPIGRTIAAIVLDLGIAPAICQGAVWQRLASAMKAHRGSPVPVIKELRRRVDLFEAQDWTCKDLPWPESASDGVHRVLDFFIGQNAFQPAPAATAGPS